VRKFEIEFSVGGQAVGAQNSQGAMQAKRRFAWISGLIAAIVDAA